MRLAIPTFKEEVAPSFDFSKSFSLFEIENDNIVRREKMSFGEQNPLTRVRQLKQYRVDVLICNALRSYTERLLQLNEIRFVSGISGNVDEIVRKYLQKEIQTKEPDLNRIALLKKTNYANLYVCSQEHFKSLGYDVQLPKETSKTFIDFIGTKRDETGKSTKTIAVCCGGHLYKVEEEIREFARETGDLFDENYYVHPVCPGVQQLCDQYQIILLGSESLQKTIEKG